MPRFPVEKAFFSATLVAALVPWLACGGSDSDEPSFPAPPATTTRNVTVSAQAGQFENVPINAGVPKRFTFSSPGLPPAGPFDALTLDIEGTLQMLSISPPSAPALGLPGVAAGVPLTGTAEVRVRAGLAGEEATVCDEGKEYGPFTLPLDGGPVLAGAEDVKVDPAVVQTINRGAYAVCIEVTPTEDAEFTINGVSFEAADCAGPVGDVSGVWSGPYRCTDSCGDDFGGTVRVTIDQQGINASYFDDISGAFQGTVCEKQMRYSGGYGCGDVGSQLVCNEVESGVFVRTGENKALKRSEYSYIALGGAPCGGVCTDELTRVIDEE